MSTTMCFHEEIRKIMALFRLIDRINALHRQRIPRSDCSQNQNAEPASSSFTTNKYIYLFLMKTHMILIRSITKHTYSNILKILPPKYENFLIKNSNIFHVSAQNIDCGYTLERLDGTVLMSTHHLYF